MINAEDEGEILAQKILERMNEVEIGEEDRKLIEDFMMSFYEMEVKLRTYMYEYYSLKQKLTALKVHLIREKIIR